MKKIKIGKKIIEEPKLPVRTTDIFHMKTPKERNKFRKNFK